MTAKKVDYPAKLVGYRIDVVNDLIVLFGDILVLFNDRELERRIGTYRALAAAGGIPYTFELFSLKDFGAAKADICAMPSPVGASPRARPSPSLPEQTENNRNTPFTSP